MNKFNPLRLALIAGLLHLLQLNTRAFSGTESGTAAEDSTNIALVATASTSFVSDWENLGAVNDGFTPINSNDKTNSAYGNWYNPNSYQWVQYEWNQQFIATSVEIYWFDDGGGVLTPDEAYIENYDTESGQWVKVVDVPRLKDQFNKASLGELTTSKLRVTMKNYSESTGILEFIVWGRTLSGGTDVEAPSAPGTPEILGISETSVSINWEESLDNGKVAGYYVLLNDSIYKDAPYHMATLKGMEPNSHFMLAVQAYDESGNLSRPSDGIWVFFGDEEHAAQPYIWPEYSPSLKYNFRDEYPALDMPTKDLDDCPQVVGTQSSGWWTFKWGPNKRSVVTEAAITPMLERLNKDFAYFRDTMGWPPDKRAKEGYRSAVYLYGSGLSCIDNADSTALGGWQSGVNGYPCILASYYPIYSFDPSCPYSDRDAQMGAMVHEGIHSVLADMPGCKKAAWFHEGGNTWLQQEMEATKSQDYSSMGFLNAPAYLAPFMPIECYTGWLQDGTFGGPSAEGVNMFNGSQQICTWRRLLGGNQYGNTFPTFLGQVLGKESVAWIWRNCPERVLEGMSKGLGDMQIRRLIMEYRAKQALIDMEEWSGAIKKLLDGNINSTIGAEWQPSWIQCTPWKASPYVKTWMQDTENKILTPEPRTTPGWSGANQIPLMVSGDKVVVNFMPIGKNMTCQLCYRATDGTAVYSKPVSSGECSLNLDKTPANGVVIAVICNTDYVYEGEDTRKAHFDYRLQLVEGVSEKASVYRKWYDYKSVVTNVADPVEPFPTEGAIYDPDATTGAWNIPIDKRNHQANVYPNPLSKNDILKIDFGGDLTSTKEVRIIDASGAILYVQRKISEPTYEIPLEARLGQGVYFVNIKTDEWNETQKFMIR
ncbi:T9SS type A sorting domain-containing protein [Maribellus sediminis]|uniref:T9SS type A sorting domain-containing protein n=1 Tax=Maribellus sediminis TaxID=2696285 RepID=UPI0014314E60|nr:T9SS type A sorting domain-containing protein [Maribellus sediminis]